MKGRKQKMVVHEEGRGRFGRVRGLCCDTEGKKGTDESIFNDQLVNRGPDDTLAGILREDSSAIDQVEELPTRRMSG